MVARVSNMLKTVKNVEDEAGRGVRSLENTIDSIEADLAEFSSGRPAKIDAGPEDLIRRTKVLYDCSCWRSKLYLLTHELWFNA